MELLLSAHCNPKVQQMDFRGGEQDEAAQMVFYIFTIVVPLSLLNPHQPTAWLVSAV
ncbi:hypothetical protein OsJ_31424 [Oryza sativa Japonica Group]|uniref:Uncharacterized protein n=1 Tax=Oryza sativa subsp. japonica TaxID=39947 RepID=B9G5L5_ORYSJ|nr:hypothetical protein OsJ_31424 [Oryza sativa Japonica Group]